MIYRNLSLVPGAKLRPFQICWEWARVAYSVIETLKTRSFSVFSSLVFILSVFSSTCKRPSTLDVESQRGPEFIHVKSQCYLQKLPLFNSWPLGFGCFLIEKYTTLWKTSKKIKIFGWTWQLVRIFVIFQSVVYFSIKKQPKPRGQELKSGNFCK